MHQSEESSLICAIRTPEGFAPEDPGLHPSIQQCGHLAKKRTAPREYLVRSRDRRGMKRTFGNRECHRLITADKRGVKCKVATKLIGIGAFLPTQAPLI